MFNQPKNRALTHISRNQSFYSECVQKVANTLNHGA